MDSVYKVNFIYINAYGVTRILSSAYPCFQSTQFPCIEMNQQPRLSNLGKDPFIIISIKEVAGQLFLFSPLLNAVELLQKVMLCSGCRKAFPEFIFPD